MIMASELGRQGDHANSIAQYREALKLNPELPGAHFELAEQLRTASDPALNAQAEDEYKAAIRVNPNDELSWRQLGGVLSAKGDFKAAEEDYRKALALQPRDAEPKTGLAIVLISLNRTNEAIGLLESAIKDDPTNTVAHFRLSALYRRPAGPRRRNVRWMLSSLPGSEETSWAKSSSNWPASPAGCEHAVSRTNRPAS